MHTRQQAGQVIRNGRQCSEGSIRQILRNAQQASTQALRTQDNGEQAALEAVNTAGSLTELRPSHLQSGQASANRLVTSQVVDCPINLVRSEVRLRFEQNFGSLEQQLENAVAIFNQSNHNAFVPPPDKPDPSAAWNRTDKRPTSQGACIFAVRQAWRRRIHNSLAGTFTKTARHEPCRSPTGSHIISSPTVVNDQIIDTTTQSNARIVGEAPAMAPGTIYQTMAHFTGTLFGSTVSAQQQQNALVLTTSNMGAMRIYNLNTAADAGATEKAGQLDVVDNLTSLLTALKSFT